MEEAVEKKKTVKKIPLRDIRFNFGEIKNVRLSMIDTKAKFENLYKGNLSYTDINKAWAEAEKLLKKHK